MSDSKGTLVDQTRTTNLAYIDSNNEMQAAAGFNMFYPQSSTNQTAKDVNLTSAGNIAAVEGNPNSATKKAERSDSIGRAHNQINQHITEAAVTGPAAEFKCEKLLKPSSNLVRKLLVEEKDERYRYLLRHGNLHHIEAETFSIYVELPQIPNILIIYRRPVERE